MISVAEARARIVAGQTLLPAETVGLGAAVGRVLAVDVVARVSQPPAAVSAMDGYAARAADIARVPVVLRQVGEAPAGGAYHGRVGKGETVRIFTGAPVPTGADAIVIQEDTAVSAGSITVRTGARKGRYVREAGLDFKVGDVGIAARRVLTPRDIGLAAAMNVPWLEVRRRPRIALLATGDEIVRPGDALGPNQIVSSNALALAAMIERYGGEPIDLGIAADRRESVAAMAAGARGADMLVTMGGVSVGDHDVVQSALADHGLEVDFWQIAMRPGKPLLYGKIAGTPLLGFPGNPVSSLVSGLVFLAPALAAMLGIDAAGPARRRAVLGGDLAENDHREDYLRAELSEDETGNLTATPFARQDSSMLRLLAQADCLVVRAPHAPAAHAGEIVDIIPLGGPGTLV